MKDIAASTAQFNLELANAKKYFASINSSFEDLSTTFKNVVNDLSKTNQTSLSINKSFRSLSSIAENLSYDQKEINRLSVTQLEALQKKTLIGKENLLQQKKMLENTNRNLSDAALDLIISKSRNKDRVQEAKQLKELRALFGDRNELEGEEQNYIDRALKLIAERLQKEKDINKTLGLSGKLVDGIVGSLGKLGIRSEFFENLKEDMRDTAVKSGSMWKVLGTGVSGVFGGLKNALKDPLTQLTLIYNLFKSLVVAALDYEKIVFETAKNLGLNVKESEKLLYNFHQIAINNTNMALTGTQLSKTYQEMTDRLGVMTNATEEFMTTSSTLMRNLGLSAEQMESIQLFAVANNKTVKETFASVIGTAKAQGARLKIAMTEKQIMDGIGKVSATVFNNFKGNVVELSKAVVQATKFGTTLDQINQAGMQFLDFESSISKEFEAQLLTGKQMDLTMARQYALTGETDKLMGEITKQLGSQNAWNNMNVIQQQSLAESLGMSKEAVDEMFKKQQLVSVLGEQASKSSAEQYEYLLGQGKSHADIVKLMGEEAAANALQASAQDKMTAAMQNMSLAVGAIADAFLPITSVVSGIASLMGKITGSSKTLAKIMSAIMGYYIGIKVAQGLIYVYKQRELILDSAKKAGEIMSMRRASFTAIAKVMSFGGPAGLIFAGLAAAALAAYAANLGVESVGSSVGVSSTSANENDSISPMNQPAATAKANAYNSQRTEGSPKVFVNITDNSRFDPLGANQVRDLQYNIVNSDGKTGGLGS